MPDGHAVIDGSNIATEGRSEPSLAQLREAVKEFAAENDFEFITVIVDATFEHRVAKKEQKAARAALDDGEIIMPPAGVVGRGDAFILQVADRAEAVVLSNDSFQEFHGTYDWLFEEGRLIGGKPVPGVGWVYVARTPVRGPVSRRATRDATPEKAGKKKAASAASDSSGSRSRRTTKKAAGTTKRSSRPGSRRTTPPDSSDDADKTTSTDRSSDDGGTAKKRRSRRSRSGRGSSSSSGDRPNGSNDPAVWSEFREDYPEGSSVAATVERFSSHGAYGSVGDAVVYLPNRLLGDPPPNRARDVLKIGEERTFVVDRFDDDRNGIDLGLPDFTSATDRASSADEEGGPRKAAAGASARTTKKSAKRATKRTSKSRAKKATTKTTKRATKKSAKKTSSRSTRTTTKKATKKTAAAKKATKKTGSTSAKRSTK